ncbi:hypothetical protein [Spiroplasma alleghenense]|uniref:Lipoprotein n=1 Tax=Spiroplasma alleghenense TaxID=216931 RepID=A0A345Z4W8_9MOLU|nr:hypothetical protein [Spiroplasma alleghenense]AXK51647.1 hypothetical protein SALLE_v1c09770 [Spiroplasma alleghenense]
MTSANAVSCADTRIDINRNVEIRDLGYLENLEEQTILNAFREKNPKAKHDSLYFYGDTNKGTIRSVAAIFYKGEIRITYTSKISFIKMDNDDECFCEINKFEEECVSEAKLLVDKGEISQKEKNNFSIWGMDELSLRYELIDNKDLKMYFYVDKNKPFINQGKKQVVIKWYDAYAWECDIYVDIK